MRVVPYFIPRYDSTLLRSVFVRVVGYNITSPTLANAEVVLTVRHIPILVDAKFVVLALVIV